jgi:hypothetical protein
MLTMSIATIPTISTRAAGHPSPARPIEPDAERAFVLLPRTARLLHHR